MERRLRKRRSEARIRLRIASDASLLEAHHASQVPQRSHVADDRIVQLLQQLVSQQDALFATIAGVYGWTAGQYGGQPMTADVGHPVGPLSPLSVPNVSG